MTGDFLELTIVLGGFAAAAILFYQIPRLPRCEEQAGNSSQQQYPLVSVIIPARNEKDILPLLLGDLKRQSQPPFEVICVDDGSEDGTGEAATVFDVKVITVKDKPEDWVGKSWACQKGADAARTDLLLFLDADVRLGKNGIMRLLKAQADLGCAISVQPYHRTRRHVEQLSMMFNLLQLASTGMAMPRPYLLGLYGPVILISRADYQKAGGHETVRSSIIEDIALGIALKKAGIPFALFLGDQDIEFRMYPGGLRDLLQGWTKNLASGAGKTPPALLILVVLWITSMTSAALGLIRYAGAGNGQWTWTFLFFYLAWAGFLFTFARRIGAFPVWMILCYPASLFVFIGVFAVSVIKKALGLNVTWKGRSIHTGGNP